jgi:hypothetical protein
MLCIVQLHFSVNCCYPSATSYISSIMSDSHEFRSIVEDPGRTFLTFIVTPQVSQYKFTVLKIMSRKIFGEIMDFPKKFEPL